MVYFFDMNERAFAYHRHCLKPKKNLNKTFLRTFEFVADELFDEVKRNKSKVDPEYIKIEILKRRDNLQYRLDLANMKDGCFSQASITAKQHYEEFSHYRTSEIRKFIDDRTEKLE